MPGASPNCAVILGSGWGDVAEIMAVEAEVDYADIPCLGKTVVSGHPGRLLFGSCGDTGTLIFQGRRHWYEGAGWEPVAAPVYIAREMGVSVLVLTNAAGGIAGDLTVGDLMIIDDHINFMGVNPLIGPHDPSRGARFPDQTEVYDSGLRELLTGVGRAAGVHHGIYAATTGPTYETPAEVRALAAMGADAVGMSTVPEAILANAAGMRVAGLSCITNMASGLSQKKLTHDEVIGACRGALPGMRDVLTGFFREYPA